MNRCCIGGTDVEKYQIEQVGTDLQIALYAIVIKEFTREAILHEKKRDRYPDVKEKEIVYNITSDNTNEGDAGLLIG